MKIFKIIIFNIIIIFLVLLMWEYILYKKDNDGKPFFQMVNQYDKFSYDEKYRFLEQNGYYIDEPSGISYVNFRKPIIYKDDKKKPIILFGCSYAWGSGLKENQTFYYKLSKIIKRTVYNRAMPGWGPQYMLFQLKREDFYKSMPEPEYIIYLYISNHILRIYKYPWLYKWGFRIGYNQLRYIDTKDGLKEEHRLKNIPYSRVFNELILFNITKWQAKRNGFEFLEKHLIESKKEVEKHWKNVKFVIFDYESEDYLYFNIYPNVLNKNNVEKLRKDGFIVIKTSDLTNISLGYDYYISRKDKHPNEAAWNLITPLFVKKLQEYK